MKIIPAMTGNTSYSTELSTATVSKRLDQWFEALVANDGKPLLEATGTFTAGSVN